MIGRVPHHTSLGDDIDPGDLFVFIPGALASGFLISIALLVADAFRKLRNDTGVGRRVAHTAAALADEVRAGAGAARRNDSGLRSRHVYGVVSAISFALVTAVVPGATWNFFNPTGYISNIGWIWAISLVVVLGFAALGVQTLRIAPEWLPVITAALGVGLGVRFAFGSEPEFIRITLIVSGLSLATIGTAATCRARRRRDRTDVPPSARPLLARTPLARPSMMSSDHCGRTQLADRRSRFGVNRCCRCTSSVTTDPPTGGKPLTPSRYTDSDSKQIHHPGDLPSTHRQHRTARSRP